MKPFIALITMNDVRQIWIFPLCKKFAFCFRLWVDMRRDQFEARGSRWIRKVNDVASVSCIQSARSTSTQVICWQWESTYSVCFIVIIIIHEFHRNVSLEQNFRAAEYFECIRVKERKGKCRDISLSHESNKQKDEKRKTEENLVSS